MQRQSTQPEPGALSVRARYESGSTKVVGQSGSAWFSFGQSVAVFSPLYPSTLVDLRLTPDWYYFYIDYIYKKYIN